MDIGTWQADMAFDPLKNPEKTSCQNYRSALKARPYFALTPMRKSLRTPLLFLRRAVASASLVLLCVPGLIKAAHHNGPPVNKYGAPVIDAKGYHVNYDRDAFERIKTSSASLAAKAPRPRTPSATPGSRPRPTPAPRPGPPPPRIGPRPFWQYAVFGSDIGGSNIIIGPVPLGGGTPEI